MDGEVDDGLTASIMTQETVSVECDSTTVFTEYFLCGQGEEHSEFDYSDLEITDFETTDFETTDFAFRRRRL